MTSAGSDVKALVAGLSAPFTHMHKYAITLQELERTMDVSVRRGDRQLLQESHVDRGDTQRAVSVYRDLAVGARSPSP